MSIANTHMSIYRGRSLNITIFEITKGQWLIGVTVDGKHVPTPLRPFISRQGAFNSGTERGRNIIDAASPTV